MTRSAAGLSLAFLFFLIDADATQAQGRIAPLNGSVATSSQIAERMPAESRARIVVHGERLIAWNASVVGDSIAATVHGKPRSIPLSDIDTIWVKTGSRAVAGALLVGIPFVGAGVVFGGAGACMETPCHPATGAAIVGPILGGLGAAAGGILGSMITRWTLVVVR